jgi:hypothetical protein
MAKMGNGYGSEFHLLRFLGRHRAYFDQQILTVVGAKEVEWLDSPFDSKSPSKDREWKSLNFLDRQTANVTSEWEKWWPVGRGIHNWDAVGRVNFGAGWEWLLVEAKANVEEIRSSCGAVGGLKKIEGALTEVKAALNVPSNRDWLNGYYQFCNRVAVLHFLNNHQEPSHLLLVYFLGDRGDRTRTCPETKVGWDPALAEQKRHVGLGEEHPLRARIHALFLPVCPDNF